MKELQASEMSKKSLETSSEEQIELKSRLLSSASDFSDDFQSLNSQDSSMRRNKEIFD